MSLHSAIYEIQRHEARLKPDLIIEREYLAGLNGYKTHFKLRKRNSECDNACEKQLFRRGSWRTKKFWRKSN